MRKEIAATLLAVMMLAGAGCSDTSEDDNETTVSTFASETDTASDESDYQGRFELWSAQRTEYMLGEDSVSERTPYSGTDPDGNDYESYLISADGGTYTSIEVIFDINTDHERHCEFYNVAPDLMCLVDTSVSTAEDGNLSMQINRYAYVSGSDIYLIDSDLDGTVTYSSVSPEDAPLAYMTFDEVISVYAG